MTNSAEMERMGFEPTTPLLANQVLSQLSYRPPPKASKDSAL